jgi:hypothetical protein
MYESIPSGDSVLLYGYENIGATRAIKHKLYTVCEQLNQSMGIGQESLVRDWKYLCSSPLFKSPSAPLRMTPISLSISHFWLPIAIGTAIRISYCSSLPIIFCCISLCSSSMSFLRSSSLTFFCFRVRSAISGCPASTQQVYQILPTASTLSLILLST